MKVLISYGPFPLRKKLGLGKSKRALVTEKEGKIIIEPVKDLLDQKGSLKTDLQPSPTQIGKLLRSTLP